MAAVFIALGSNRGNRREQIEAGFAFLEQLSDSPVKRSSIYVSEPVGPAERDFYNALARIETGLEPPELLKRCKAFEKERGRDPNAPRWSARLIDLDLIGWDNLVVQSDNLIIPHPEYHKRLFVLLPLRDVAPGWKDPATGRLLDDMISNAPPLRIQPIDQPPKDTDTDK